MIQLALNKHLRQCFKMDDSVEYKVLGFWFASFLDAYKAFACLSVFQRTFLSFVLRTLDFKNGKLGPSSS